VVALPPVRLLLRLRCFLLLLCGSRLLGLLLRAHFQLLERRLAVDGVLVMTVNDRPCDDLLALIRGDRADLTVRRDDERALDDRWRALLLERGDERFADAELRDDRLDAELGIRTEGLGRRLHGFLIAGGER